MPACECLGRAYDTVQGIYDANEEAQRHIQHEVRS